MSLIDSVVETLWQTYGSYKKVTQYVSQWIEHYDDFGNSNFYIVKQENSEVIDLYETICGVDDETLMRIAVNLGVSTPDFIPVVSDTIPNLFKVNYSTALDIFNSALRKAYDEPDAAIGLANSALESIIKHVLKEIEFSEEDKKKTLYKLAEKILKNFDLYPTNDAPKEVRQIGSSLLNLAKGIEDLRSDKTTSHGRTNDDYLVRDPLYAVFIINTVATIGLFIVNLYEKKYATVEIDPADLPF